MKVALFIPCFVDAFYPGAAIATLRILQHLGINATYPQEQTCCGQPFFNAGHIPQARDLAKRYCEIFDGFDAIVCPSGSCTAMVRNHYEELLGQLPQASQRTFELAEFLVNKLGVTSLGAKLPGTAVVHIGCHGLRELGIGEPAHKLLAAVEGLEIRKVESETWCCGFGGTFSVKFPEISTAMTKRKLAPILREDVDYLISTDSSCIMQLGGLLAREKLTRPRPLHLAEVLASGLEAK